jgi:histidinol-phosphate aminotransferase
VIANWQGIVVLDEAYIDFCPQFSMVPRLSQFPNLAIMQTFSKAWGMAGVRLGTAIASPEIIALLQKVKMPYNIGALKENFVLEKLADLSRFDRERHAILQEKERLFAVLQPLCVKVFASDANFLLVRLKDGHKAYAYLRDHGVIVRNFSSRPRLANCLRITIGTPA